MGQPQISVVVPTRLGVGWLPSCLNSLIGQDVDGSDYEVLVVQHGPDDGTSAAVADASARRPDVPVRHLRTNDSTRAAAKNAGLAECVGSRVMFVHDEDRVSPRLLRGVLDVADDRVIGLPLRVPDPGRVPVPAILSTPVVRRQLAHAGGSLPLESLPTALGQATGLCLPRDVLDDFGLDDDLVAGEDIVLLARLLLRGDLSFTIPQASADAVYYRATRRNALLPRVDAHRLLDGLQRLDSMALPSRLDRCRTQLVRAGTEEINRYLRTHTDDHATVITERRARGLEAVVDLRRLNDRVARDLAVLYVAPPSVDTSANVAARRILKRERIVDVISCNISSRLATDPSSDRIWSEFVDRRIEVDARPADIWWPGVTEFCYKGLAQINALERSKGPYRTVYSRTMHPTSPFLAAWFKLRRPEVSWLAEFSDPVRQDVQGALRPSTGQPDPVMMSDFAAGLSARGFARPVSDSLHLWLETLTYALADEITFTNENQRDFMLSSFPDRDLRARAAANSVVSHHPQPPERLYSSVRSSYELPRNKLNLAYFGVFYATRGLTEIWQALKRLPDAHREAALLHVFTSKPEDLQRELITAGLEDVVRANPYVSYLEYLNLASRMDALIVNDARTMGIHPCNPYLPSKWSDYAGSGSAVWGIVEPGSILSGQPLDYRSELGDVDGALRVLVDLVESDPRSRRTAKRD